MEWEKAVNTLKFMMLLIITMSSSQANEMLNDAMEKFNEGVKYFNLYNYEKALENFTQCNTVMIECVHNTGATYLKLGDNDKAYQWFNAGARYGYKQSIMALKENSQPVPKPDLAPQSQSNGNGFNNILSGIINVLNAAVGGYNRGADAALRTRPRNATCTTIGNTVNCQEY